MTNLTAHNREHMIWGTRSGRLPNPFPSSGSLSLNSGSLSLSSGSLPPSSDGLPRSSGGLPSSSDRLPTSPGGSPRPEEGETEDFEAFWGELETIARPVSGSRYVTQLVL